MYVSSPTTTTIGTAQTYLTRSAPSQPSLSDATRGADAPPYSQERDLINFDHPESLETELMVEHLQQLITGNAVDIPVYDFATHLRRTDRTLHIEPRPVIIVEGILILNDQCLRRLVRAPLQ